MPKCGLWGQLSQAIHCLSWPKVDVSTAVTGLLQLEPFVERLTRSDELCGKASETASQMRCLRS